MPTSNTSKLMRGAIVASLAGVLAAGAVSSANAQQYRAPTGGGVGSIVSCDAPGGKQAGGALIGALLGAAAGSNLAKNDRGTGTAIGAVAGAATGSYVGCKMQRDAQTQTAYGQPYAQPATYVQNGYRLNRNLAPARYVRDGGGFVATSTLNLRAAPTTGSARVGSLRAGESFQALARVRGSEWILVGRGGVGVGYVHGAYVQPAGYQQASYGY
ncbi:SH3 domain-containing protein [Phenylobacterium sp.]|uniref:SH3 domain-containing protein n=1 Tax=Phenylobacterium sp. TaxID=1871053 RepID=UPI0027377391|nr:SH3 domain-containing protein [Phenylobacterium sp.]MDP3854403.1 SH3 domain-containing protein [Phenylobacterium sp.]